MSIAHFYHCWADGEWEPAAREHVVALAGAGFRADLITVGLVGGQLKEAYCFFTAAMCRFGPVAFVTAAEGWEQVTLVALHDWARTVAGGTVVLYAHAKGAYNVSAVTAEHRQIMTRATVGGWRAAVAALDDHDVAGCFWDPPNGRFIGNFWWARAGYVAGLPPPREVTRHDAEAWIGLNDPVACELHPDFTYAQLVEAFIGRDEPGFRSVEVPPPQIPFGWAGRMY